MLVTNGQKIVTIPHNEEELERISKLLVKRAKDVLGISKVKFKVQTEPFPHISNESELTIAQLKQMGTPDMDIQFRAIGKEKIQHPEIKMMDIKHTFSDEEKAKIADDLCNTMYEIEQEEAAKKSVMDDFKQKIGSLETKSKTLADKHRSGFEIRTMECNLHLDFEKGVRIYTAKDTDEMVHTEPMEPKDYQMKIEFTGDNFDYVEAEIETASGEMNEFEDEEPFGEDE